MGKNGNSETRLEDAPYATLGRKTTKPTFEKDILTPSPEAMEAISQSYFPDEQSLNNACLYIAWLEMFGLEDEKRAALYKINGNKAIKARALRWAVQAHGGLYWPEDSSKDEKKFLAHQFKDRGLDDGVEENKRRQ